MKACITLAIITQFQWCHSDMRAFLLPQRHVFESWRLAFFFHLFKNREPAGSNRFPLFQTGSVVLFPI